MTTIFCVYSLLFVRIYSLPPGVYHRCVFTPILMCSFVVQCRMTVWYADLGFCLNLWTCRQAEKRVKVPKRQQEICGLPDVCRILRGNSNYDKHFTNSPKGTLLINIAIHPHQRNRNDYGMSTAVHRIAHFWPAMNFCIVRTLGIEKLSSTI